MPHKFKWQDRDTAARDMLQLLRHGPPSVRSGALRVLQAIRSPVAADALLAMVQDTEYSECERAAALRTFGTLPGDIHVPQLAPLFRTQLFLMSDWYRMALDFTAILDNHPSNRPWFFQVLTEAPSPLQCKFIPRHCHNTEPLALELHAILTTLVEADPDLLNGEVVQYLYDYGEQELLNQHIDRIVAFGMGYPRQPRSYMWEWAELYSRLVQKEPHLAYDKQQSEERQRDLQAKSRQTSQKSELWLKLESLHQRVEAGDEQALREIDQIAWRHKKPQDMGKRAPAIHFLGKHVHHPFAFERLLANLHFTDYSGDHGQFAPVRSAAARALKNVPSPRVWEALVDTLLILQSQHTEAILVNCVAYVTDVLSGDRLPDEPQPVSDEWRRGWHRTLSEDSE